MHRHDPQQHPAALGSSARQPVYYLSHGGGPWPFMGGPFREMFRVLERSLQDLPRQLPEPPRAILIVTGHWEETHFSVSTAAQPGMIYDYHGFPEQLYQISYPAPGSPALAEQTAALLEAGGWRVRRDPERGYDHGTYSLLKPIYPQAEIPVVQLSLLSNLDPVEHFAAGQALMPLREQGVLILGSGQSFHNLRARGPQMRAASEIFDTWLRHTLLDLSIEARNIELLAWEQAPMARVAHPRAEHLIPLMVVAGAAGAESASCVFGDYLADFATSAYRFSADAMTTEFDLLQLHHRNPRSTP